MKNLKSYNNHWLAQIMRAIEGPNADFDLLCHYVNRYTDPEDVIFSRFKVDHDERDLSRFYCDRLTPGIIAGAIDVWMAVIPTNKSEREREQFESSMRTHIENNAPSVEGFRKVLEKMYEDLKDTEQHQGVSFKQFVHEWARDIAHEDFFEDTSSALAFLNSQYEETGLSEGDADSKTKAVARELLLQAALGDWPK